MNKISNFGYTKVTNNEKTRLVQKVFSNVASRYDLMNDIMSIGTHRLWKKRFVEIINPRNNEKIIDVGSGSGDIVKEILKTNFDGQIHMVDLNKKMLNLGKKSFANNKKVYFHIGNAEKLKFNKNYFDKNSISFCLRNITNIESSISEAYRVLKPGGKYCCLEFNNPESIVTNKIYKKYKSFFLPLAGKIVAGDKESYSYLSESIDLFPSQEELKNKIKSAGFIEVSYINLFNGIVCMHSGYKA